MLAYFAFTLFVSASLLFFVQPMVGKMILPRLGGTPAVWTTCMVFFQAVLLIGYAYTHSLSRVRDRRLQLAMQLVILLLPFAFFVLPFSLGNWVPSDSDNPVFEVLWLLLGMVGLPFFVVATSAPLLQKWFADTGHPAGKDPYFLYGASNLGSMLALLLYPLMVEPDLDLDAQTLLWTVGYGLLIAMVAGCMVIVWRAPKIGGLQLVDVPVEPGPPPPAVMAETKVAIQPGRRMGRLRGKGALASAAPVQPINVSSVARPLTWPRRIRWICLAAAPSSLMLGVTTHLTTDIAAVPFFWVIPLALYLLTFILVFSRQPVLWIDVPHTVVLYVQPFLLGGLVLMISVAYTLPFTWMTFAFHVLVFFLTALMCHGELAKDRPATQHLTEFYLWMSVGGVLGGMFNALFAPKFFQIGVLEYPIAMVFACLLRPRMLGETTFIPGDTNGYKTTTLGRALNLIVPFVIALMTCGVLFFLPNTYYFGTPLQYFGRAFTLVIILAMFGRPFRFAISLALFMLIIFDYGRRTDVLVFQARSFFGFVRVRVESDTDENKYNALIHGGINHGWQAIDPAHRRDPITYFHPTSGIGQLFTKFDWPDARMPAAFVGLGASPFDAVLGAVANTQSEPPYGVIGLGIGTLGAHAKPYQHVRFFEIDPLVKRLSVPPEGKEPIFYYIRDAEDRHADIEVVIGDGRLLLAKEPNKYYHILVIDAFSSDAIPVHLLTREALEIYLSKLADGGVLIFNTTNRYLNLTGPLADLANDLDLDWYNFGDFSDKNYPTKFGSDWMVMQRKDLKLDSATFNGGPPVPQRVLVDEKKGFWPAERLNDRVWTDRFSNLLRRKVMRWGR